MKKIIKGDNKMEKKSKFNEIIKIFVIFMFIYSREGFGTVSWDYSEWLFNINGRTTLIHCTYWGLAGLLYTSYIEPLIPKIEEFVSNHKVKIMATSVAIFMIFNITISSMAAMRQKERLEKITDWKEQKGIHRK